jgi:hypothetical protein
MLENKNRKLDRQTVVEPNATAGLDSHERTCLFGWNAAKCDFEGDQRSEPIDDH